MKILQARLIPTLLLSLVCGFSISSLTFADEIPMTINGQINCANPANAMTTTCGGGGVQSQNAPPVTPPPVASAPTPEVSHAVNGGNQSSTDCSLASNSGLPTCQPMTINGQINCANPNNSVTTTCWDQAQAAKSQGGVTTSTGPDCTNPAYKDFPACSGVPSEIVLSYQENQKHASAPVPIGVNCADPALIGTIDCTKPTAASAGIDCSLNTNNALPLCQPMTINGEINCLNPDNSITTTCWEQSEKIKANGGKSTPGAAVPDCTNIAFKDYPACSGVAPEAVVIQEAAKAAAAMQASEIISPQPPQIPSTTAVTPAPLTSAKQVAPIPVRTTTAAKPVQLPTLSTPVKVAPGNVSPVKKTLLCVKGKIKVTVTTSSCPKGYKAG